MSVQRLSTTDAFVVVDLEGAERADGVVRCAKKVLVDSTTALARARTYAWALLGQRTSGASAAVNAQGDGRGDAIGAFVEELAPRVAAGELVLAAGKGVAPEDLAAWGDAPGADPTAAAEGLLACASVAAGGLDGRSVAIEHAGVAGEALAVALEAAGASVVSEGADALGVEADVLMFGSKVGLLDHQVAATLRAKVLVPTGDLPFTPRALAVATRGGATVLPDFLTTAGPLAARAELGVGDTLAALTEEVLAHNQGAVLGACLRAERTIAEWAEVPFGRPIG